jgi:hypothetical protein
VIYSRDAPRERRRHRDAPCDAEGRRSGMIGGGICGCWWARRGSKKLGYSKTFQQHRHYEGRRTVEYARSIDFNPSRSAKFATVFSSALPEAFCLRTGERRAATRSSTLDFNSYTTLKRPNSYKSQLSSPCSRMRLRRACPAFLISINRRLSSLSLSFFLAFSL